MNCRVMYDLSNWEREQDRLEAEFIANMDNLQEQRSAFISNILNKGVAVGIRGKKYEFWWLLEDLEGLGDVSYVNGHTLWISGALDHLSKEIHERAEVLADVAGFEVC